MATDRCIHGILHGMCSICLRREREIEADMKRKHESMSKETDK